MGCEIQPDALRLHTILRSQLDSPCAVGLLIAAVFTSCSTNGRIYQSISSVAVFWPSITKEWGCMLCFFLHTNKREACGNKFKG